MDYKETIKERLNVLSPELRAFVIDEKWRGEAEKIGKQFNFDEEKYASFENEIFLVLLCFEPLSDFIENIKRELEIDANMAGWMAEDVDKNIFSKVANEIDAMWQAEDFKQDEGDQEKISKEPGENQTQNSVGAAPHSESGVGTNFEQIILNQAKAMMPARPADESGGVTSYEVRDTSKKEEKPNNLPTGQTPQHNIPDYRSGEDPYREPLG